MSTTEHRRAYQLAYGYTAEFVFRPGPPPYVGCEWDPGIPDIGGRGARQRLLNRYLAAREDFMQDVVQWTGMTIALVDVDHEASTVELVTYTPVAVN